MPRRAAPRAAFSCSDTDALSQEGKCKGVCADASPWLCEARAGWWADAKLSEVNFHCKLRESCSNSWAFPPCLAIFFSLSELPTHTTLHMGRQHTLTDGLLWPVREVNKRLLSCQPILARASPPVRLVSMASSGKTLQGGKRSPSAQDKKHTGRHNMTNWPVLKTSGACKNKNKGKRKKNITCDMMIFLTGCLVRRLAHTVNLLHEMVLFSLTYNFIFLTHFDDKVCCQAGSSVSHSCLTRFAQKRETQRGDFKKRKDHITVFKG